MLQRFASLKLTVFCLIALAILVLLGTIDQVEHGLYLAQQKYFNSFFIWFGFLPLPSALSIMYLLGFNLLAALICRFSYSWKKLPLLTVHFGLLLLLISGFLTINFSKEAFISLREGELSNIAQDYNDWELAIVKDLEDAKVYPLDKLPFKIESYYKNSQLFKTPFAGDIIKEMPLEKENEKNIPALFFEYDGKDIELQGMDKPSVMIANKLLILRRVEYKLPFSVELLDVSRQLHTGTEIAAAYKSKIMAHEEKQERKVRISMNKPYRNGQYTLYQSSYAMTEAGDEISVFAVVKNLSFVLPYIASLLTAFGLFWHFGLMFWGFLRKNKLALVLLLLFLPQMVSAKPNLKLDKFKAITIVDQGRKQPLDSYARGILFRFSGKSKLKSMTAIEWLSKLLFDPETVKAEKVFLINNPEILESLELEPDKHRCYSFSDLEPGIDALHKIVTAVYARDEDERGSFDKEYLRIFQNLHSYIQLTNAMQIFTVHEDFSLTEPVLGLDKTNSLHDVMAASFELETAMTQITRQKPDALKPVEKDSLKLAVNLYNWIESYKSYSEFFEQREKFLIVKGEEWANPWSLLLKFGPDQEALQSLSQIAKAYENSDQENFDSAVQSFVGLQGAYDHSRELFYKQLNPFGNAKFLYGFGFLFLLFSFLFLPSLMHYFSMAFVGSAFLLHSLGIVLRILILERAPVTNLFETFVFVSWVVVLIALLLLCLGQSQALGLFLASFAGLALLLISGKFAADGDSMGVLIAVLNSNFWLSTHVICVTIGYAGVAAAGLIGHVYLLGVIASKAKQSRTMQRFSWLLDCFVVDTSCHGKLILSVLAFGLCFSFLGTMLGGIWADQSWGRFWGWDPKENGALLIVLWTTAIFHARLAGLVKQDGIAVMSVIGTAVVVTSWFGINLLGVGLHSYGFTDGIANNLKLYYLFELLFLLVFAASRMVKKID